MRHAAGGQETAMVEGGGPRVAPGLRLARVGAGHRPVRAPVARSWGWEGAATVTPRHAMYQVLPVDPGGERDRFCQAPGLPVLSPEALARQRPDGLQLLVDAAGRVAGRAALWWRDPPTLPGQRLGLLGHY